MEGASTGKVVLLKLFSGDMVIGAPSADDALAPNLLNYELDDPRMLFIMPDMRGDVHVGIKPVCAPFKSERLAKHIKIPRVQVMFELGEDELDVELVNGYKSEVSGIKIASTSEAVAINSHAKGGEFSLGR